MTRQWLRSLLVVAFAGILAGCASQGTQTEPTEPAAEPDYTQDTTPAPDSDATTAPPFDASGNPFVPGTTQMLSRTFYFDYDRSVLNQDDLAALEMHASILRDNPDRSVVIEGHADERGTREYNLALAERRADAIRSFLTSSGVSPRQVESVSYGEERPEDPGHDEGAWARNRRAILVYR